MGSNNSTPKDDKLSFEAKKSQLVFCLDSLKVFFPKEIVYIILSLMMWSAGPPSVPPIRFSFHTSYSYKTTIHKDPEGLIESPQGIAISSNDTIIVINSRKGIALFDRNYKHIRTDEPKAKYSGGAALDKEANLYVCDYYNHLIKVFDQDGQSIRSFPSSGQHDTIESSPYCIAVDRDGNVLVGEYDAHCISVFDPTGNFLFLFGQGAGTNSSDDEEKEGDLGVLNCPSGISIDNEGNIIVTDQLNHRIQIFDSKGKYLRSFDGGPDHKLALPSFTTVDRDGNIAVCDTENHLVRLFTTRGEFICEFGDRGKQEGQWDSPRGIAADSEGNIYVTDWGNNRVLVYEQKK